MSDSTSLRPLLVFVMVAVEEINESILAIFATILQLENTTSQLDVGCQHFHRQVTKSVFSCGGRVRTGE
jgi:hypothetical protein